MDTVVSLAPRALAMSTFFTPRPSASPLRPPPQARATSEAQVRQTAADVAAWEGCLAVQRKIGVYFDAQLDHVQAQLREAELAQAGHRARAVTEDIPTYILTSTPTDEVLDEVYDDPPIGPPGIPWRTWLRIGPLLREAHVAQREVAIADIAAAADVTYRHAAREGWLAAIARWAPHLWVLGASQTQTGRGRRRQVLLPVDGIFEGFGDA